jgi:hypothetical protein
MNPFASHWLRLSLWLLVAIPLIAFAVATIEDVPLAAALVIAFWVWVVVCVILAAIALAGMVARLVHRGWRALRR